MKKTSAALTRVQEGTATRRQLLESGAIRLRPQGPKPAVHQKGEGGADKKG